MKVSKIILLGVCVVFLTNHLIAQSPCWYLIPPTCRDTNFIYAPGHGTTKNLAEAEAWKYFKIEKEGAYIEDITFEEIKDIGLEKARIKGGAILFRTIRNTDPNATTVYVLILFPKHFSNEEKRKTIKYPEELLCDKIKEQEEEQKQKWEQEQEQEQKRKRKEKQEKGIYYKYSNQLYFNVGTGITYGKAFGISLEGRHGSHNFGIGWQSSFGGGEKIDYVHWSVGAKLYPYKWFFLSANYGTVEMEKIITQNTDDGYFIYKDSKHPHRNWSYLAGVDILCGGNRDTERTYMTINMAGGVFRSENQWSPAWSIGIGIGGLWN